MISLLDIDEWFRIVGLACQREGVVAIIWVGVRTSSNLGGCPDKLRTSYAGCHHQKATQHQGQSLLDYTDYELDRFRNNNFRLTTYTM
jgi:hypothetical protein